MPPYVKHWVGPGDGRVKLIVANGEWSRVSARDVVGNWLPESKGNQDAIPAPGILSLELPYQR